MFAVKGIIRGDTVLVDAAAVREYQGRTAVVTVIDDAVGTKKDGVQTLVFLLNRLNGEKTQTFI